MTNVKLIEYENVYVRTMLIEYNNIIIKNNAYMISNKRKYHNKNIVLMMDIHGNTYFNKPEKLIYSYAMPKLCERNSTLFISSECKTPRDLYRNSGYNITRNIEKADVVVIPYMSNFTYRYFDILARKQNDIYMFITNDYIKNDINKQAITKYLSDNGYDDIMFGNDTCYNKAYFVPKSKEYSMILTDDPVNFKYAYERDVEIDFPVKIDLDTLNTWKYMEDYNLRIKMIVNSDITKYPLTMIYFSSRYWSNMLYSETDPYVRHAIDSTGFDRENSVVFNIKNIMFSKEDYDLVSSFILQELELPENGGYTDNSLNGLQKIILKTSTAVMPRKVTESTNLSTIIDI